MRWPFSKKAKPTINPVAIPMPKVVDPSAFDRVPAKLLRTQPSAAARQLREKNGKLFAFDRGRAELVGATHYRWRTCRNSDVCEICASRDGKTFAYKVKPEHGYAGICTACPQGW